MVDGHDTAGALSGREVGQFGESGALVLQADKTETGVRLDIREGVGLGAADGHTESLVQ